MAYTFSTNQTPTTGTIAMFNFLSTAVAAGALDASDSDGTTYAAGGGQVTGGGAGAHGLANNKAWFRVQFPAVNGQKREFVVQGNASDNSWRIKYSPSAGFVAGSPSATQVPSATDEVVIIGGGTDAAPTFVQMLPTTNGTYRQNIAVGGAPEQYSFYFLTTTNATGAAGSLWFMDVMVSGTFPSADLDSAVISLPQTGNFIGSTQVKSFLGALASANFVTTTATTYGSLVPVGMASNAWTSKDDVVSVLWARGTTTGAVPHGVKGYGTMILYDSVTHGNMDTLSVGVGTRNYLFHTGGTASGYLFPWDGSVPTI